MRQDIWLVRASWRGTAMTFRIPAKTEQEAQLKAERQVFRMEGGRTCLEVKVLRKIE